MIYFPTTSVGYFLIGDCIQTDMISSMSNGLTKQIAEGVMMAHLISAVPIVVNPPNQYFEELMNIPKCKIHLKIDFIIYWKMLSKSCTFLSFAKYYSFQLEKVFVQNVFDGIPSYHWTEPSQFWCHTRSYRRKYCDYYKFHITSSLICIVDGWIKQ